ASDDREHRRIRMHVLVGVEMRQPDAGALQPRDLRRELALDLVQRQPPLQTGGDEPLPRWAKSSGVLDERRNVLRRQRRRAVHEREMRAEAERWTQAAAANRVV